MFLTIVELRTISRLGCKLSKMRFSLASIDLTTYDGLKENTVTIGNIEIEAEFDAFFNTLYVLYISSILSAIVI